MGSIILNNYYWNGRPVTQIQKLKTESFYSPTFAMKVLNNIKVLLRNQPRSTKSTLQLLVFQLTLDQIPVSLWKVSKDSITSVQWTKTISKNMCLKHLTLVFSHLHKTYRFLSTQQTFFQSKFLALQTPIKLNHIEKSQHKGVFGLSQRWRLASLLKLKCMMEMSIRLEDWFWSNSRRQTKVQVLKG